MNHGSLEFVSPQVTLEAPWAALCPSIWCPMLLSGPLSLSNSASQTFPAMNLWHPWRENRKLNFLWPLITVNIYYDTVCEAFPNFFSCSETPSLITHLKLLSLLVLWLPLPHWPCHPLICCMFCLLLCKQENVSSRGQRLSLPLSLYLQRLKSF